MIKNVYKLPPKSTLTLRGKELSVSAYADWKETSIPDSYTEAKIALKEKVVGSVKRQLVSDVPLGIYLSGGIDSSAVLSSMSRFNKNIQAFSVGFDLGEGEEGEKFNHDLLLAKKTANHFGAKHNTVLFSSKEALLSLEEAAAQCDDPVSNPTSVAMLLLAKFAKPKVSVVLTGSGGDELFGGYDRYRIALAAYYFKKLPGFIRSVATLHPKIAKFEYANNADLFAQLMFQKDSSLSRVVSTVFFKDSVFSKRYFEECHLSHYSGDPSGVFMKTDQASWLPEYFLMLSDKMSMKSALEERVPLIDRELRAFSDALPRDYKLDLFNTKKILKDAFREELPEYLFNQPKRGWFSPGAKWLRRPEFIKFTKGVLSGEYYSGTAKLFNWPELQEVLDKHIKKEKYNLILLWAVLTFQLWAKSYRIEI